MRMASAVIRVAAAASKILVGHLLGELPAMVGWLLTRGEAVRVRVDPSRVLRVRGTLLRAAAVRRVLVGERVPEAGERERADRSLVKAELQVLVVLAKLVVLARVLQVQV